MCEVIKRIAELLELDDSNLNDELEKLIDP